MIVALLHDFDTPDALLATAGMLAEKLNKTVGVLYYVSSMEFVNEKRAQLEQCVAGFSEIAFEISVKAGSEKQLQQDCDKMEASFLLIQMQNESRGSFKKLLSYCRELRIPYLFFKKSFSALLLKRVLVPVRFLIEDYEKAQFASAFGRFCASEITLLQAKDYGSKAATTTEKMRQLFDKFSLKYKVEIARKDSYKLYKDAVRIVETGEFDLLILSASRAYGPDDFLFGPPELRLLQQSVVPILMINPRGDLYSLCD